MKNNKSTWEKIQDSFESEKGKVRMNFVYCLGAAIVLVGALLKIMHWPGAAIVLPVGMIIEALIFALGIFERPAAAHGAEAPAVASGVAGKGVSDIESKLDQEVIEKFEKSLADLTATATGLGKISNAVEATNGYTSSLEEASTEVKSFSEQSKKGNEAINGSIAALTESMAKTKSISDQIAKMQDNITISDRDSQEYHKQTELLNKNLTQLNAVYSNMLKSMTINNK